MSGRPTCQTPRSPHATMPCILATVSSTTCSRHGIVKLGWSSSSASSDIKEHKMPLSEQADRDVPAANTGQAWAKRRMHHIFARDGRAVVVAMDGARDGPAPGLERPADAVARVVAGGVDA